MSNDPANQPMDDDGAAAFVKWHCGHFRATSYWLSHDAPPGIHLTWKAVLADVTLAEAKAATLAMASGDIETPTDPAAHPRAIKSHVERERRRKAKAARGGGSAHEATYRCPNCMDTGVVIIWHPIQMAEYAKGNTPKRDTAATFCVCESAESAGKGTGRDMATFDPARHVRFTGLGWAVDVKQLDRPTEDTEDTEDHSGGRGAPTDWDPDTEF